MKWDLQEDFVLAADVWVSLDWEIRQERHNHFTVWHKWGGKTKLQKECRSLEEAMKYASSEVKKREVKTA